MKTIILILLSTVFVCPAAAQSAPAATAASKTDPVLTVVNEEGKAFEFAVSDLAKLTRQQVKAIDHNGKEVQFEGVSVAEVLKLAGVRLGGDTMRGKRLVEYLLVEARDNYRAVFSLTEFDPEFTDAIILLADKADGKPLDEKSGPWQIVVPNQKKHGRWVREVVKLSIRVAESTTAPAKGDSNDEEAIYEAVFRKILGGGGNAGASNYYLEMPGKQDPSEALMRKLGDIGTRLKKGSESFISQKEGSIVLDKKTKKQGILFQIYKFEWIGKDEARVAAGSYAGNMGAGSCTYKVKRENGKWVITGTVNCMIS